MHLQCVRRDGGHGAQTHSFTDVWMPGAFAHLTNLEKSVTRIAEGTEYQAAGRVCMWWRMRRRSFSVREARRGDHMRKNDLSRRFTGSTTACAQSMPRITHS